MGQRAPGVGQPAIIGDRGQEAIEGQAGEEDLKGQSFQKLGLHMHDNTDLVS